MKKYYHAYALFFIWNIWAVFLNGQSVSAIRVVVAGTSHGHSGWILKNWCDRRWKL
jgi:hypothetical protein